MKPKFKTTRDGIEIIDPIDRQRFQIESSTPVVPSSGGTIEIPYPVETTCEIITERLTTPRDTIYVRNPDGSLVTELQTHDQLSLPEEKYILDLSTSIKVYAGIEGRVQIHTGASQAEIILEEQTPITLGARSHHTRPAATVSTPAEPTAVMEAVSRFGSALKTTTTERAYPTLRGHPPAIERADELSIPDTLSKPKSGVQIKVPPTLQHVFIVTPLAYYLAGEVVPGSVPKLITDTGFAYELERSIGFEDTVERVLKQVHLLDCIVRTEGSTPLSLHERQQLESILPFDVQDIHGRPLAEQLEAYLEIPLEHLEAYYSRLPRTRVKPTPEQIEFLPFIAADLATVSVSDELDYGEVSIPNKRPNGGSKVESHSPAVQRCWTDNDGTTITSIQTLSALRNNITQTPRDGPIEIDVICNDPEMNEELVTARSIYNNRDDLPFHVTIHLDLTTSELEDILVQESDFVHYIGHIDADGFRCSNGTLDATEIDTVGLKSFFLNACHSFEQGHALLEAGAIGGIVTSSEIQNADAIDVGKIIAKLLNSGFPLYAALTVLKKIRGDDNQHHIIGDERVQVAQTEDGAPGLCKVSQGKTNRVGVNTYLSQTLGRGSIFLPHIKSVETYYLVSGEYQSISIPKGELVEFFADGQFLVLFDGELRWSTDIKTSEL